MILKPMFGKEAENLSVYGGSWQLIRHNLDCSDIYMEAQRWIRSASCTGIEDP